MFSVWLVFTSNLNSQTSWLKFKFKLKNLNFVQQPEAQFFKTLPRLVNLLAMTSHKPISFVARLLARNNF